MTNTPGFNHYRIQLKDMVTGQSIIATGAAGAGVVFVAKAGTSQKETLTDKFGNSLNNPLALTRGLMDFCIPLADLTADLYIQTPGGHFLQLKGIGPSGLNEYPVDGSIRRTTMMIPFNIADTTAATETDTKFILPSNGRFLDRLHGCGLNVVTAETTGSKTINVGLLSSQSGGVAAGLINGSSTATVGQVIGTNGSLFSTNAPALASAQTAQNVSYTLSSTSATAAGFIILPLQLDQA